MKEKIKVSVIMPVYNAQDTLTRILDQLERQTLQGIEIIMIDDCSTDSSYEIAGNFQKEHSDSCVLLKTETNLGPGGARNLGLGVAGGEYLGFVDADDEIALDMFEKLYKKALETDADIVDAGYYNEKLDYAIVHTSDDLTGKLDDDKRSRLIVSGGYMCSKIFRHSFIKELHLKYREHVSMEDSEILTKIFAAADSIANVKEVLYKYSFTDISASRERSWKRYYQNVTGAMRANYESVKDFECYAGIQKAVEYLVVQLYCYGISKCLSVCSGESKDEITECLRKLQKIKKDIVQYDYSENDFVKQKMEENDIRIMQINDSEPEKLVELILQQK